MSWREAQANHALLFRQKLHRRTQSGRRAQHDTHPELPISRRDARGPVDFGDEARCFAYSLRGASVGDGDLYVMINGHGEDHSFTVLKGQASDWRRAIDIARPSPEDIVEPGNEPTLETSSYTVRARSVVVLRREPDAAHS